MIKSDKPIIGVVSCAKVLNGYQIHSVNNLYLDAIKSFGGIPLILVHDLNKEELNKLFYLCDGFLFPGSHSNVSPRRYGAKHQESYEDEQRDELAITIIKQAIEANKPCFGICRGFQEMNVALGGTLDPDVYGSGFDDHREKKDTTDFEEKYASAHIVKIQKGGVFEKWLMAENDYSLMDYFDVNTLHNQGVKDLSPKLRVEAVAPDGLIEAFSLPDKDFFVGVQWHPEWKPNNNYVSQTLFKKFIIASLNHSKE